MVQTKGFVGVLIIVHPGTASFHPAVLLSITASTFGASYMLMTRKLAGTDPAKWHGRAHFFGAASEAMRRILIDKAREKAALKRGPGRNVEELHESQIEMTAPSEEILAVHDALDRLALEDATAAEVVKLRYFVGMTVPEIAEALDISPRSADRHWSFARAWLKSDIRKAQP